MGAIVCAAAVLVIGVKVHGVGAPLRIDLDIDRRLPALPPHLAREITALVRGSSFAFCVALLVVGALALRDRYAAMVSAIAGPIAVALTEWVGKPLAARAEPAGLGYPSGHVTATAVIAALMVLIGCRRFGWWGLAVLGPTAIAITTSMAIAVIRLRFHYFSDTVGGALVGVGTVAAVASLVPLAAGRRPSRAGLSDLRRGSSSVSW